MIEIGGVESGAGCDGQVGMMWKVGQVVKEIAGAMWKVGQVMERDGAMWKVGQIVMERVGAMWKVE